MTTRPNSQPAGRSTCSTWDCHSVAPKTQALGLCILIEGPGHADLEKKKIYNGSARFQRLAGNLRLPQPCGDVVLFRTFGTNSLTSALRQRHGSRLNHHEQGPHTTVQPPPLSCPGPVSSCLCPVLARSTVGVSLHARFTPPCITPV